MYVAYWTSLPASPGATTVDGEGQSCEPLSEDLFRKILSWIPPPVEEETESWKELPQRPTTPSTETLVPEAQYSDSDSDVDSDLVKKLEELVIVKQAKKGYGGAAVILEKVVDHHVKRRRPQKKVK